jgi:hypothetical protein
MPDADSLPDVLRAIAESLRLVSDRCSDITSPDDFLASDDGLPQLDGICMRLLAIGEALKRIDKVTEATLFRQYP